MACEYQVDQEFRYQVRLDGLRNHKYVVGRRYWSDLERIPRFWMEAEIFRATFDLGCGTGNLNCFCIAEGTQVGW